MKVEILTPPNESLLSSMLYEGYIRIVGECGEEADEKCIKKEVFEKLKEKKVNFRFTGNDLKQTLPKIQERFKDTNIRSFQDLMDLFASLEIQSLRVDVRLCGEKEKYVFVGVPDSTEEGYSFQIMKIDRYGGISSTESETFTEHITTYADLSGLLMFFVGLASSYVTSQRTEDRIDYYFLFFDARTLLAQVLTGGAKNVKDWMRIKDGLLGYIKEKIEEYGDINDEAITLSVLCNSSMIEELRKSQVYYTGFRLIKMSMEGQTYKVYVDMPLRIYPQIRLHENWEEEKRIMDEIEKIIDTLIRPASRFIKGRDNIGDGYHAFKALRYLYLYVTTGNPEYLNMTYREIHEAYTVSKRGGAQYSEAYLRCFMKHMRRF